MKLLVLSDSHSGLRFMRRCLEEIKPDAVVHLGDYFEDGLIIKEEHPGVPLYQVSGNCDRYRCPPDSPEVLVERIGGADFYLTHGHRQRVKSGTELLLREARRCGAAAVLYGHTHTADCHREADGLWVLNPGSCGYFGGSAGLIDVEDGEIKSCRILHDEDLP